jgi:hypothetical protein
MAMVFKVYLSPCTLELYDSDCRKHLPRGLIIWMFLSEDDESEDF